MPSAVDKTDVSEEPRPAGRGSSFCRPRHLLYGALVLTALVYWNGLGGPFLFDDPPNIIIPIQAWLGGSTGWQEVVFGNHSGPTGRPLSMLSFAVNAAITGLEVAPFKATNLVLHLVCGALVFRFALELAKRDPWLQRRGGVTAVGVAAIWLLHPIQVSTVLYVVQRMTQLSTLFTLLALIAYLHARVSLQRGEVRSAAWLLFAAVPITVCAAVLSKENGALAPLLCATVEFCYFRGERTQSMPHLVRAFFLVFLIAPGLAALGWYAAEPNHLLAGYAGRTFSLTERLLSEPRALLDYLSVLAVPRGAALGLYTDDFPVSISLLDPATTLIALFTVLGLVLFAFWVRPRARTLAFGILFFLAAHAMESSIFPLELYFEHRNYLPSLGAILAAAGGLGWIFSSRRERLARHRVASIATVATGALCALFALSTFARASAWRSWSTLVQQGIAQHPSSLRARLDYASILMAQGQLDAAEDVFEGLATSADRRQRDVGYIDVLFLQCYRDGRAQPSAIDRLSQIDGSTLELGQTLAFEKLATRIEKQACAGLPASTLADHIVAAINASKQPEGLTPIWRGRYAAAQLYAHDGMLRSAVDQAAMAWMSGRSDPAVGVYLGFLYLALNDRQSARFVANDVRAHVKRWDTRNLQLLDTLDGRLQEDAGVH